MTEEHLAPFQAAARQAALFSYVEEVEQAVSKVGKKLYFIAVLEPTQERLVETMRLIAANVDKPGSFSDFVASVRVTNEQGQKRIVVKAGRVLKALIYWSNESPNLMRGWSRKAMAQAFEMQPSDKRLDYIAAGMTQACEKLGFTAKWHKGRFKVLAMDEVADKLEQSKRQIEGRIKAREKSARPLEVRGYDAEGKDTVQLAWWNPELKLGIGDDEAS